MEVLFQRVDSYVDSLAPQIQPRITAELDVFQQKTIDILEDQVVDAFRSLFKGEDSEGRERGGLNDAAPDAYGGQSLPFADEVAKLTRSFGRISEEAGDDLRDIFDMTEGSAGSNDRSGDASRSGSSTAKSFLTSALDALDDGKLNNSNSNSTSSAVPQFSGLLNSLSTTIKDAARNPEEKARRISPEIKDVVAAKLREQHAPIAEQFTRIALEHIKRWLRGNTSSRDLGDGAKAEVEEQVKGLVKGIGGLFSNSKKHDEGEGSSRGVGDGDGDGDGEGGGGFSRVISDKLSTGLAKVHREVRLEFRKILGVIERQLFELLPDQFQRPLEKILGGNPFDAQLGRDPGVDRGFGDDLRTKLLGKIRDLVRKVQESLRESILGVVNGGHRKFERESWVFVQSIVEAKVQRYLPDVKIRVPDDIGNEGVSVGAPTAGVHIGGPGQAASSSQEEYKRPEALKQHGGQAYGQQDGPHAQQPQYQHAYRDDAREQYPSSRLDLYHHQESRPEQYPSQDYRSEQHQHQHQYHPPPHEQRYQQHPLPPPQYQSNPSQGYDQGSKQHQNYPPNDGVRVDGGYPRNDGYEHSQMHEPNQGYGERREYGQGQGEGEYRSVQRYGAGEGYLGGGRYGQNAGPY